MFRKIVSIFLLLITLVSFVPVASAQQELVIDANCIAAGESFSSGIGNFVITNILWGAGFMAVDMLTSFLETLTIFGFNVGGIFEPFDHAMNFMRDIWMKSLIFGIIASVFNWFAGSLIEAAMVLNLTLTADNPLVNYGGKIILQIANFGFVVAIIFVGIATILRLKKDELSANKLLIKLIVGIILVNLTIPIASAIADLGTKITMAMYKASSPCPENITKQFTVWVLKDRIYALLEEGSANSGLRACEDGERPCEGSQVPCIDGEPAGCVDCANCFTSTGFVGDEYGEDEAGSGLTDDERKRLNDQAEKTASQASAFTGIVGGLARDFLSMITAAVLSLIAALTFLTFGAFLIIRFVIMMLLLVFSPLIWFGFIFKDLKLGGKNIWSSWWSQFLKWSFFGPVIVLFLAFVSEYLNTAATNINSSPTVPSSSLLSSVPAGVELFGLAQLISVIVIAAMGIFLAAKFSGVAGSLAIGAASAGLGFVAGKTQGIFKRGQVSSQMRAEQLKKQGRTGAARFYEARAKLYGGGLMDDKSAKLLGQIGIKPKIGTLSDAEARKQVAEKRAQRLGGKTGFGSHTANLLDNDKKALAFSDEDINNLSPEAKKNYIQSIRRLQTNLANGNKDKLTPKEELELKKKESKFSSELNSEAIKGMSFGTDAEENLKEAQKALATMVGKNMSEMTKNLTEEEIGKLTKMVETIDSASLGGDPNLKLSDKSLSTLKEVKKAFSEQIADSIVEGLDPDTNPQSVFRLSNSDLNSIGQSGSAADQRKIEEALQKRKAAFNEATTELEKKEAERIEAKIDVLKQKGGWAHEPVPPKRPIGFGR